MKPGRELDALVAEKVLGCKVRRPMEGIEEPGISLEEYLKRRNQREYLCSCPGRPHMYFNDEGYNPNFKHYSTNMGDAWEVADKLCPTEDEFRLARFHQQEWECTFAYFDGQSTRAATAPLAICLAALKAVGYEP